MVVSDWTVPSRIQSVVKPVSEIAIWWVAEVVSWTSPQVRLVRVPPLSVSNTVIPGAPVMVTVEGTTKLARKTAVAVPVTITAARTSARSLLLSAGFFMVGIFTFKQTGRGRSP